MVHGWEQQLVLQQHARQRRCRERRGREHHELVEAEWRLALAIGATVVTGMLGGSKGRRWRRCWWWWCGRASEQ